MTTNISLSGVMGVVWVMWVGRLWELGTKVGKLGSRVRWEGWVGELGGKVR